MVRWHQQHYSLSWKSKKPKPFIYPHIDPETTIMFVHPNRRIHKDVKVLLVTCKKYGTIHNVSLHTDFQSTDSNNLTFFESCIQPTSPCTPHAYFLHWKTQEYSTNTNACTLKSVNLLQMMSILSREASNATHSIGYGGDWHIRCM